MKPLVVHCSDTQLKNWEYGGINPDTGLNRRFEDALGCFNFVIDHAIKLKKKNPKRSVYFVHAGDVNEERNPDSICIDKFAECIQKLLGAGIKVIIVSGNHDSDSSIGTTTSVSYLKRLKIPGIQIIDNSVEALVWPKDKISFLCMPYLTRQQLGFKNNKQVEDYLEEKCQEYISEQHPDMTLICVSHYTVENVFDFSGYINEPVLPINMFKHFDYCAFGHIHKNITFEDYDVYGGYCGSPYKVTFGENHDKFFHVFDCEKETYVKKKIPNRDFLEFEIDAREADQSSIERFVEHELMDMDLDDKFIKIKIICYKSFNPRPIYDHLKKRNVFHYLPIQFEREKIKSESRLESTTGMNNYDIVNKFLEKQDLKNVFKKRIKEKTKDIIEQVGI